MLRRLRGLALALAWSAAIAAEVPGAGRFGLSADGAWVLDLRSQVAWPRCVEGMRWNGKTCVGAALLLTHDEALALARDLQASRGLHLRLPRVAELQRLVQGSVQGSAHPHGLDSALFPAAPPGWYWSATAVVNTSRVNPYDYGNIVRGLNEHNAVQLQFLHAWAVNLSSGDARADHSQRTRLPVRLLLPLD